jgi:signal recognition particle receptor subunit beta
MAIFNYAAREMTAKIVYYGPGLSGKTTSIQYIHQKISPKSKGKLVSLATETDRTLFFDFFPVEFGQIGGFKVKFNFYTVPGQVFYNTTRKLVLKGADGVVFVADSQQGMMEQNLESLENLKENLKAHGIDWQTVPFVIQYNKQDLPGVLPSEELAPQLNPGGVPHFETTATTGQGIMEAMKTVCKMVLEDIQKKQKRGPDAAVASRARPTEKPAPTPQEPAAPAMATADERVTPADATQRAEHPARVEPAPGIQRTLVVPVKGPGSTKVALGLPMELELGDGVEAVQVMVHVNVNYLTQGAGRVLVRELSSEPLAENANPPEPTPEPPPKKRGFFARMFGG